MSAPTSSDSEDDLPPVFLRIGRSGDPCASHYDRHKTQSQPTKSTRTSPIVLTSNSNSSSSTPEGVILCDSSQEKSGLSKKKRCRDHTDDGSVESRDPGYVDEPSTSDAVKRPRLQQAAAKELALVERMEKKKQQALEKRKAAEERRLEKERKQAEKKQQNDMKKALKKAASDSSKESRGPADRVKQMIVVLDRALVESAEIMTELTTELSTLGVAYEVGTNEMPPGSVTWKRKMSERTVDTNAKIIENVIEVEEKELLVTLEAQGLAGLVHCTKMVDQGIPLQDGACTLQQFVEDLQQRHRGKRISLAVEGMESFFRGNKTHFNRKFRNAVRSNQSSVPSHSDRRLFTDVTSVDCMEATAGLQLSTDCVTRMCADKQQLAEHVIVMTKALSEAHFRKDNPFSFHVEAGQGASRQALRDTDNRVSLIWKHQLMQFNNISDTMATAVVATWPSPAHLLNAYKSCSDKKSAELLLQDVVIRRGVGVVASTRRFGPAQSKRIHAMMTSKDPKLTLS